MNKAVVADPARVPASPEAIARAMDLIQEFPQCFCFFHHDLQVRYTGDLQQVVERLKNHGDSRAWEVAKELRRWL